jgi:hypothetical protein
MRLIIQAECKLKLIELFIDVNTRNYQNLNINLKINRIHIYLYTIIKIPKQKKIIWNKDKKI